jgi:hypothetical protein
MGHLEEMVIRQDGAGKNRRTCWKRTFRRRAPGMRQRRRGEWEVIEGRLMAAGWTQQGSGWLRSCVRIRLSRMYSAPLPPPQPVPPSPIPDPAPPNRTFGSAASDPGVTAETTPITS